VEIGPRDTAEQAFRKVLPCARAVLARQMDAAAGRNCREIPQDEAQATYFSGRKPDDGRINWTQSSRQIFNLIRAVTDPYPGRVHRGGRRAPDGLVAESDSPATHGRSGRPGEILSLAPLLIASSDGALELTRTEWRGAAPALKVGQILA